MRWLALAFVALVLGAWWWFARESDVTPAEVHREPASSASELASAGTPTLVAVVPEADPARVALDTVATPAASAEPPSEQRTATFELTAVDEFGEPIVDFALLFEREQGVRFAAMFVGPERRWVAPQRFSDVDLPAHRGERGRLELVVNFDAGTTWCGRATVHADGRETVTIDVALDLDVLTQATVVLRRLPVEIFGSVCDPQGRGVAGVELEARSALEPRNGPFIPAGVERVVTDTTGAFEFPRTRREFARGLIARPKDWDRVFVAAHELGPGLRIVLRPAAKLVGVLREPSGGRVGSARVQLRSTEAGVQEWIEPALVVVEGRYAFEHAPSGAFELHVWRARGVGRWAHAVTVPVTLEPGVTQTLDVEVPELE